MTPNVAATDPTDDPQGALPVKRGVRRPTKAPGVVRTTKRTPTDDRSQRKLDAALRMREAYEMRKAGASFDMIADRLGYHDASAASKAVKRIINKVERESGQELLILSEERLNAMLLVAYAKAIKGDLSAMDRVIRLEERLNALRGQGHISAGVAIDKAVIIVGGTEQEYIEALQNAASRQETFQVDQGFAGELTPGDDEWDAWEHHEADLHSVDVITDAEIVEPDP